MTVAAGDAGLKSKLVDVNRMVRPGTCQDSVVQVHLLRRLLLCLFCPMAKLFLLQQWQSEHL